jgi:hypothetical protein
LISIKAIERYFGNFSVKSGSFMQSKIVILAPKRHLSQPKYTYVDSKRLTIRQGLSESLSYDLPVENIWVAKKSIFSDFEYFRSVIGDIRKGNT